MIPTVGSRPDRVICDAIAARRVLEFDYDGLHRVVHPYCHGLTRKGAETLRAVQVNAESRSGGRGYGKLWTVAKMSQLRIADETFAADDPDYNPDDTALPQIHCRVTRPSTALTIPTRRR